MIDELRQRKVSMRARALAIPAGLALAGATRFGGVARAQTPPPSNASGSIRLAGATSSPAETDIVNQVLKDFSAAYPNIKVTFENISTDYFTKLQTDLAAGNVADVFYLDSLPAPDLMVAGQLLALDDYMAASGVKASDFFPGLIKSYQYGGKTYGLPKDFSSLAMIYSSKAFSDAGVTAAPTTWDELSTVAKTLKDKTGQPQICIPPDVAREFAFHFAAGAEIISADGSKIVIDSPAAKTALDYYYGLYKDGLATTPADAGATWPGDALAKGLASIVFEGNWFFPFQATSAPDLKVGIAEMPAGPAGKADLAFTVSYSAYVGTKNPDAAWTLINYLTGPLGMKKVTDLGLAMPSRPGLSDGWAQKFPERQPFIAAGAYAHGWQLGPGGNAFYNDANADFQGLFAGKLDTATTLQKWQQEAENRIKLSPTSATPEATPTS
jgi:multiple sugar transport system substrate-binding protein